MTATAKLALNRTLPIGETLAAHWQEFAIEGALLGMFMVSACCFGILLEHPALPVRSMIQSALLRRSLMGIAMGATAIALVYSPWGKKSGAHFNPAVTLAFLRLRKIAATDAIFYIVAQFTGGTVAVLLLKTQLASALSDGHVGYVATVPGRFGIGTAAFGEFVISFLLMTVVLNVANSSVARFTGAFAGLLVASFITFEAPISGMSMNPARSFSSALPSGNWTAFWIYMVVPPVAMVAAAEIFHRSAEHHHAVCAKLHHDNDQRCIHCGANGGKQS